MATTGKGLMTGIERQIDAAKTVEDCQAVLHEMVRWLRRNHERTRDDVVNIERRFSQAASGWVDDGSHFRMTVTGGVVTDIADSAGGGHS